MNFDDNSEQAAFRARVRAWLAVNAPHALAAELRAAAGTGISSIKSKAKLDEVDAPCGSHRLGRDAEQAQQAVGERRA